MLQNSQENMIALVVKIFTTFYPLIHECSQIFVTAVNNHQNQTETWYASFHVFTVGLFARDASDNIEILLRLLLLFIRGQKTEGIALQRNGRKIRKILKLLGPIDFAQTWSVKRNVFLDIANFLISEYRAH